MTTASLVHPSASSSSSSTRAEVEVVGGVFVCSDSCSGDIVRNLIVDYGSGKITLTAACIQFCVPCTRPQPLLPPLCHSGPINTCFATADDRGRSRFRHYH
ncbi:hypothetical protein OsI_01930 [Oryza sativa Indica Group]|nr:hypothetical protein OsI_01930 [Oryza sativa Indica Group]